MRGKIRNIFYVNQHNIYLLSQKKMSWVNLKILDLRFNNNNNNDNKPRQDATFGLSEALNCWFSQ